MLNKKISFVCVAFFLLNCEVYAKGCINDPNLPLDGININFSVEGLTSAHIVKEDIVSYTGDVFWQSSTMFNTPLNGQLYKDGELDFSEKTVPKSSGFLFNGTWGPLLRGTHELKLTTTTADDCVLSGNFIVQDAPTATANTSYSTTIPPDSSSSTVSIPLSATHTVDQEYSLNGSSPEIKWTVNGQTFNQNAVNVDLAHGNYTAIFTVDDGIFKTTATTNISVLDLLKPRNLRVEPICNGTSVTALMSWSFTNGASYYEIEYKPQFSNWIPVATTSSPLYDFITGANNQSTDSLRVRACSSARCGTYLQRSYVNPGCSFGGQEVY